jgi:hypothetical protein
VRDEDNVKIKDVARALREPVRISASFNERVMRAVRGLPKHSRLSFWRRLAMPRTITVRPLAASLVAASLVLFALVGLWHVSADLDRAATPFAKAMFRPKAAPDQHVQFVLVAPDAKKVAVVGDFNGWDASHSGYQAQHRGGGVWSVMASVPVGHHRYSFIVDDSLWVADPSAPRVVDNDFGTTNSAIVVEEQR